MKMRNYSVELRNFTLRTASAMSLFGAIFFLRGSRYFSGFFIMAVFVLTCYWVAPNISRILFLLAEKLVWVIGAILSYVALIFLFYFCYMALGLVVRMFGVDLLDRKIEKDKKSYWRTNTTQESGPSSMEHQF
jgi:hypothetical protein